MSASLLVDAPGNWAINHNLKEGENRIGRAADCSIVIQGSTVSSRHAVIYKEGGAWYIKDLGSKNGTYVRGNRITAERLTSGCTVKLGQVEMVFRCTEAAKEEDPSVTVWGDTCVRFEAEAQRFKGKAQSGSVEEDVIELSGLFAFPDDKDQRIAGVMSEPVDAAAEAAKARAREEQDAIWVAERLSDLLHETGSMSGHEKDEVYERMLQRLRAQIGAENGFVMIPNAATNQWVIRAWVGNDDAWSDYEREHPLSLTVANNAFKQKHIVSNCMNIAGVGGVDPSESLKKLNVSSYVAVPMMNGMHCAGVIYFDIRRTRHSFEPKHIKLLHKASAYILAIEHQRT
jgi:pSer/pThr/pTyr-binding forkhead associated (FHA) protein